MFGQVQLQADRARSAMHPEQIGKGLERPAVMPRRDEANREGPSHRPGQRLDRTHLVGHQARGLFILVELAGHEHQPIRRQDLRAAFVGLREHHDLEAAIPVLERQHRHRRAAPRRERTIRADDAAHQDLRLPYPERGDGPRACRLELVAIPVDRMTTQIQPKRFLLIGELLRF